MNPRSGRIVLVLVMLAALLCAGSMRTATLNYQAKGKVAPGTRDQKSALGSMNSFALALLLGGLRGPLVMVLWSTSESQKIDKNLEDFDTKVEWIRLLQPEFVTVHLFQIWNKAYNISVQMASLPNRYATILDALDYAHSVDQSRPDDLNILHMIAQVYSNKLGTIAQEKTYYRRRVREDSMHRKMKATEPRLGQEGFQRRRMDPVLDPEYRILSDFLIVRNQRPGDIAPQADWNTGEELQYLKQYEPYNYGVSTFAFAYNYAKRAAVVMALGKQKPLQLSESVIDSRPGLEMRSWAEEEWERGRVAEMQLHGSKIPVDRVLMEAPTEAMNSLQLTETNRPLFDAAIFSYDIAGRLAADAKREYLQHLARPQFVDKLSMYQSHMDRLDLQVQLVLADKLYLQGLAASDPAARQSLFANAAKAYQNAIDLSVMTILRYYMPDEVVAKTYGGTPKPNVGSLTPEQRRAIWEASRKELATQPPDTYVEDRPEFDAYIHRAEARLAAINAAK